MYRYSVLISELSAREHNTPNSDQFPIQASIYEEDLQTSDLMITGLLE